MACPATFPPGSLTADGEAATWIGKDVCIHEETGLPACFPNATALGDATPAWFVERVKRNPWLNETTPCPLDDGDCYGKFYNCKSMYENTFRAAYDEWEGVMFFLFLLSTAYCGLKLWEVYVYASDKIKELGIWHDIKFQILSINFVACFMRVLWFLNAHSNYGWTGIVWPTWFRAIVMKAPQMTFTWGVLVITMFWRDTVQKATEMRKKLKQTKLRRFIKVSVFILFGICVPCEVVARSVAGAPLILDWIVTGIFCLYGFGLTSIGIVASRRLGQMLEKFQQRATTMGGGRKVGLHMRAQIKKIYITVLWMTFSGYVMIAGSAYNFFANNRPSKQLTFWTIVSAGEWIYSIAFSYGMRKARAEINAQKKVRHNEKFKPVTAVSTTGDDLAQSKFAGSDVHLAKAAGGGGGGRDGGGASSGFTNISTTGKGGGAAASTAINTSGALHSSGALTSNRSTNLTTRAAASERSAFDTDGSTVATSGHDTAASSVASSAVPPKSSQVVPL